MKMMKMVVVIMMNRMKGRSQSMKMKVAIGCFNRFLINNNKLHL